MEYRLCIDPDAAVLYSAAGSVVSWKVKTQFFRGKRQAALLSESGSTLLFSSVDMLKKLLTHRFPFLTDDNLKIELTGDFL